MLYKPSLRLFKAFYIKDGLRWHMKPSDLESKPLDKTYKEYIPLFKKDLAPNYILLYFCSKEGSNYRFESYSFRFSKTKIVPNGYYEYSKNLSGHYPFEFNELLNKRVICWLLNNIETPCYIEVFQRSLIDYIKERLEGKSFTLSELLDSKVEEGSKRQIGIYKLSNNTYNYV